MTFEDQPLKTVGKSGGLPSDERILTVSEVNRIARQHLESLHVKVMGEVSRLNTGYPYFVYLDLRDPEALLPAIIPKYDFLNLDFSLEEGMLVVVEGTLTLFEKQGKYQIRAERIRPFGEGEIQRRIEALKRKLAVEGLFDDSLKKPLPVFAERIGVVTSPRGAAVRDVTVTLGKRFPPARVFIRGVLVQGPQAVEEIVGALEFFDRVFPVDVVILARGGGSLQDLEPFNSEQVARAISKMSVPVITGIGHEPDITIADLVADHRASTPTGAAQAAVPDKAEVLSSLEKTYSVAVKRVFSIINAWSFRLGMLVSRPVFTRPNLMLEKFIQIWERDAQILYESPSRGIQTSAERIRAVLASSVFKRPRIIFSGYERKLESAVPSLLSSAKRDVSKNEEAFLRLRAKLEALNPTAILKRGYSITFSKKDNRIIRSPVEVERGDEIRVVLSEGAIGAQVTEKE